MDREYWRTSLREAEAEQMHQGGLARSGRPHDRDEVAPAQLQADAAQRVHGGPRHLVLFAQAARSDERHGELMASS
jgi:hypothetical protein